MIAVTGMGIVSPYGIGVETFRNNFTRSSGLFPPTHFDGRKYGLERLGCIHDFSPKGHIQSMKARRMSRFSQIALISSLEAWKMSGLSANGEKAMRTGVIVGTGLGSVSSTDSFYEGFLVKGPLEANPMIFPETVQNIAAAHISIELGLRGPNTTFSQGDIAGEFAVSYAADLLRSGQADSVLVCGVDELTDPLVFGMKALKLISPSRTLAPFDRKRDGIIPAEGAASLVLERAEDAAKRGAAVLGYLKADCCASDTADRFSYSSADAMARLIERTLRDAGGAPGFISAAANSTRELDSREASAILSVLGASVPVTALKSQTGSFMSAGVMKTAAALISMKEKVIPPVFGLEEPEIAGPDYVMGVPRSAGISSCLINSFSHGGANMCLFFTAPAEAA